MGVTLLKTGFKSGSIFSDFISFVLFSTRLYPNNCFARVSNALTIIPAA
jgi:hypothetical protein